MADVMATVTEWPEVHTRPHRFGGYEFTLREREVGHLHDNGFLDIPFPRRLRDALVDEGRTGTHHLYPDSGWTTYRVNSPANVSQAVELLRLAYLHHCCVLDPFGEDLLADIDVERELDELGVSDDCKAVFAAFRSLPVGAP